MRNIAVLGSTGSIGRQTLEICRRFPDKFKIRALTAGNPAAVFSAQINEFNPDFHGFGAEASVTAASLESVDTVVVAVSGIAALRPVMAAVCAGKRVALANKEALVAAGDIIMAAAKKSGAAIIPVDSEHSAIFQCLSAGRRKDLRRVILTASGGPLLNAPESRLVDIAPEEVVKHPRWKMGKKISVDSATMMNKGLEVIEASRLFSLKPEQIDVVIHPQSIIHSMVEYCDGSVLAQLSNPDMAIPISLALFHPSRCPDTGVPPLDFNTVKSLDFMPLSKGRFPCFDLAVTAFKAGGAAPCVLNAANEAAVDLFLTGKIPYLSIPQLVGAAMDKFHANVKRINGIDDIIELDALVRKGITCGA